MHQLTSTLRALTRPDLELADLLERRLVAFERVARGEVDEEVVDQLGGSENFRRFLAAREGSWDDGDENLVRGDLDRWGKQDEDPPRDIAARLVDAANHIGSIRARPGTVWFLLWEMEGMVADLRELLSLRSAEHPGPRKRT